MNAIPQQNKDFSKNLWDYNNQILVLKLVVSPIVVICPQAVRGLLKLKELFSKVSQSVDQRIFYLIATMQGRAELVRLANVQGFPRITGNTAIKIYFIS